VIWVDADGHQSLPEYADIMLTSVMKNMDVSVMEAIRQVIEGTFAGGTYVGTLANGGVGIAPFHDLGSVVPPELRAEIEDLRQQIIRGDLTVGP
jgi:basic membrane protein A